MTKRFILTSTRLLLAIFMTGGLVTNCSVKKVVLNLKKLTDGDNHVGDNKDKNSVFDIIAVVNPETANLMPPNFNRESSGLFEYDIMLNDQSHQKVFGPDPNIFHSAPTSFDNLWPNGIVYYTYDDSIASEANGRTLSVIEGAIKHYHQNTCIKFVKRTTEEHYIEFYKGSGCWSLIGRTGGKQKISLGYGCEVVGIAVHEMLHSLGFWHEQSRPDRDQYVNILFNNIQTGMKDQFKIYNEINTRESKYDYRSVMHYGDTAFSIDSKTKKTIIVKDPTFNGTIGQRLGLSPTDIQQIKLTYKCKDTAVTVDGKWSAWSSWSVCDRTCGGGNEVRSRTCNSPPPSNGGKLCPENPVEKQSCNTAPCPIPIECNFDQSFCLWENLGKVEMDWQRRSGPTPSTGTGPLTDHTTGAGSYIHIESSSPMQKGDRAILQSSVLSGVNYNRCFKFFYYMYGKDIGSLYVYLKYGDVVQPVWLLQGHQGEMWHEANLPIDPSQREFQILLMGVRGNGFQGDIALDDTSMSSSYCGVKPINAQIKEVIPTEPIKNVSNMTTTTTKTGTTTTKKTTSTTGAAIKKYGSFACDFETTSPPCKWMNMDNYDILDWEIINGPTNSAGTGPSSGSYAHIEGSNPAVEGDNAWLLSPELPQIISSSPVCFKFDYHMYGDGIGALNILFYNEEATTLSKYWSIQGNQGNMWHQGNVQLPIGSKQRIIIEGIRGYTFTSDIAIDNLELVDGPCILKPGTAQINEDEPIPQANTTSTAVDVNVIRIEVISEGCGDSTVRKKTIAQQQKYSEQERGKRHRRSLQIWEDFVKDARKGLKKLIGDVTTNKKNAIASYKKVIDPIKKRVVSYLEQKFEGFKLNGSTISHNRTGKITIQNDCTLAKSSILVNGVEESLGKPGHNVVVIDGKTGKLLYKKWYDTKTQKFAATTAGEDLKKIPNDAIIVIATQDSVVPQFIGKTELQKIGAVPPYLPGPQGSWAFIGYKGERKVDWIKQISQSKGNGPSRVSAIIPMFTTPTPTAAAKTIITLVDNEVQFSGKSFLKIPFQWSKKVNFGKTNFTISLWFKTSTGGTLFSKVHPTLTTYSDDIKTVYVEGQFINIKLTSGKPHKIINKVNDGLWHHLIITVQESKLSNLHNVYLDGKLVSSIPFNSTSDSDVAFVNIGKTVQMFPGKTLFDGSIQKFYYKTYVVTDNEAKKLYEQKY